MRSGRRTLAGRDPLPQVEALAQRLDARAGGSASATSISQPVTALSSSISGKFPKNMNGMTHTPAQLPTWR